MTTAERPSTIGEAVVRSQRRLKASGSPSPRLDAEVLAAHVVGRDRAWLLAHPETPMTPRWTDELSVAVERRSTGEPIAYIRGFKE